MTETNLPTLDLPYLHGFKVSAGLVIEVGEWSPILPSEIEKLVLNSDFVVQFNHEYSLFLEFVSKSSAGNSYKYDATAVHCKDGLHDVTKSMTILNFVTPSAILNTVELATNNALIVCGAMVFLLEMDESGFKNSRISPHTSTDLYAAVGRFASHCQTIRKASIPKNPISRVALRNIRQQTDDCDFTIYCQDEDVEETKDDDETVTELTPRGPIRVHSLILKSVWPFFNALLESKMSESETMSMTLPYPRPWVEALIKFFYDEHNDLSFGEATGLLVLAKVYDIPSIQMYAAVRIKDEGELDLNQALLAWRRSNEAGNQPLRTYCADYIGVHFKKLSKAIELLPDYSQEELLCLLSDLALSVSTR